MRSYGHIWGGLFAGCVVASWLGLDALAMALFPIPVATHWVRQRKGQSLGLILCAALAAFAALGLGRAMVYYVLVAALGILLGLGIAQRWHYGWIVAAVAGSAYALVAGHMLAFWEASQAHARVWLDAWAAQLADRAGPADEGPQALMLEQVAWLRQHWAEVGLGVMFWPILIGACVVLSVAVRRVRRLADVPGPLGSFREMRTPEWVVWIAIVLAVLWLTGRVWPNALLRLVTWNSAIALSALYWINGVSVLVYIFDALRPALIACCAVVMVIFLLGAHPVLCFVGLFDTWGDFRKVADRVAAARKRAQQAADDDGRDDE